MTRHAGAVPQGTAPAWRPKTMAYQTYRVEITRDETRPSGSVTIEITAYIDRVPETNDAGFGG